MNKFGIVGVSTPETEEISSPGPNVVFEDPVTSVQATVDTLTGMGVDKIVLLSHLGYEQDLVLATAVSGVDVIVGGHSHTFVYTPTAPIKFYDPEYPQYDPLAPAGPYPTVVSSLDSEPVLVVTHTNGGHSWAGWTSASMLPDSSPHTMAIQFISTATS